MRSSVERPPSPPASADAVDEPTTPLRPTDRRNWVLQSVRLALHLGVILALTLRSAQIGSALHPFSRALANEWIHLLFYVETTKRVPIWNHSGRSSPTQQQNYTIEPVTLPHFLLEIEEEIAANVEDEFFNGGFAARASSYPVGMLFTIEETKQHLHGAIANYFQLADIALDTYILAGGDSPDAKSIPFPELVVRYENGTETLDASYVITGKNESEWPEPLQRDHTSPNTRDFFDRLDAMQLQFTVGMRDKSQDDQQYEDGYDEGGEATQQRRRGKDEDESGKMFEWRVVFTYNLQSQGHLEVALNYGLRQRDDGSKAKVDLEDLPVFFDSNTAFNFGLLALIYVYQCFEFALKWINSKSAAALRASHSSFAAQRHRHQVWIALTKEAKDFWFWFILLLNLATMVCFFEAWYHPYQLSLRDGLCLAFATCCALQWISLVRYLRVNTRFHILGLTLQRGLPRVAQFLAGVLPIFVGYVLFGTVMFGAQVPRFQSAGATATTLFSVANGDEIHDTFNAVSYTPWIGQIYVYSYMILFSYVVLMVCIGIIEDSFFSAVFPASWPSLEQSEREQEQRKQQQQEVQQHKQSKRRVQREIERVYQPEVDGADDDEEEEAKVLLSSA